MHRPTTIATRRGPAPGGPPLAILFALVLLGACTQSAAPALSTGTGPATTAGGGTTGGTGSIPKDVCALLSPGDLQSATGAVYGAGASVAVTGGLGCDWNVTGGQVSVDIFSLDHDQFVFKRDHLPGTPVAGVGDEAWVGGPAPVLDAAKGPLEITVQVFGGTSDKVIAAETALARLVISRL